MTKKTKRESAAGDRVAALATERVRLAQAIAEAMASIGRHAAAVATLDAEILALVRAPTDVRMRLSESTRAWLNRCGCAALGPAWPGPRVPWEETPPGAEIVMGGPARELADLARAAD